MKQTIRHETFETNSSSYHSLAIRKLTELPKPREITPGEDLTISTDIKINYIGYTESYSYVARGTYEKAQLVLRFMGYDLEEQLDDLITDDEWKTETFPGSGYYNYDWDKKRNLYRERIYEAPLIQAFVKAIKRFIGEAYSVIFEFSGTLFETVSDSNESIETVFGVENITDVDALADRFYEIIFDNNVEMVEECESNE